MNGQLWGVVLASFLASSVEFVEAYTIVLVVGITTNWRSAFAGAAAAVATLAILVGALGTALVQLVPINTLRVVVGVLLVLFGLRWLKKAILRYAGRIALRDEEAAYQKELGRMRERADLAAKRLDPVGVATSFKSVLLEGLEVAFIVITFGAQASNVGAAALGATGACIAVIGAGVLVRAPLQRVPENTLKFAVGLMLVGFGTFWGGEGLGIEWPGADASIPVLIAAYLVASGLLIGRLRTRPSTAVAPARAGRHATRDVDVSRFARAVAAVYQFVAGDPAIIVGVGLAFALAAILVRAANVRGAAAGVVLVAAMVATLAVSLRPDRPD